MEGGSEFLSRLDRLGTNFVIGVAGDSGSGKTTFTNGIRGILGEGVVSTIMMDDYHTEDRETRKATGRLPLDPGVNRLSLLAEHLMELKKGKPVVKPVYDHRTGTFGPDEVFTPTRIVIVEGLHALYTEELRRSIDFSVYVDPDREVKWRWKVKRDVERRGHRREDVEEEIRRREPLYKRFIDHQKIYAEVVVKIHKSRFDPEKAVAVELLQTLPTTPMNAINLDLDLSGLMRASERNLSLEFRGDYYYGKQVTRMHLDGWIGHAAVKGLEGTIQGFTGLGERSLFGGSEGYTDMVGLAQLLICWRFLERVDFLLRDLEGALA